MSLGAFCFCVCLAICLGCNNSSNPPTPDDSDTADPGTPQTAPETNTGSVQSGVADTGPPPRFVDVAQPSGVAFTFYSDTVAGRYFLPEVMGGGAAWLDADRDGLLDLYCLNGAQLDPKSNPKTSYRNALFRQLTAGGFRGVGVDSETADENYGQGCAAGDFNADGFPDLYLGSYGPNVLLQNNGDGTFTDVSEDAGVDDALWTSSVVWHDVNADGVLDLYVANYLDVRLDNIQQCDYGGVQGYCGPGQYESVADQVFLSQSDGTFVEAAADMGLARENGKGLALLVADFNGDLTAEIYVANDMTPNFLFTRQKDATAAVRYEDAAVNSGCAQSGEGMNEASMGIACADFDRDSRPDLYLTHYYQMKNTLYRNLGNLMFDDASLRLGSATTGYEYLGFGTAPLDYDRDGWHDLFITNGHVLGPLNEPCRMTGQILHNINGKKFEDVSRTAGDYFSRRWLGRGVAAADFDSDGDTDIVVTHIDDPVSLLRNDTSPGGTFVGFSLQTQDRMAPVGARVTVTAKDLSQTQSLTVGGSYLCSSDSRLLFGWQGSQPAVDVNVAWPSGQTESFPALEVNRYWVLKEGAAPR